MKLKLKRRKKKIREIEQQKKIKTTKIPAKQVNQENLEDKKTEHKLKEEEQTENRKQLKVDATEKDIETSSQMNKQKE